MRGHRRSATAVVAASTAVLALAATTTLNPAAPALTGPEVQALEEPSFIFDPIPPGGNPSSPTLTVREVNAVTRVPGHPDVASSPAVRGEVSVASTGVPAYSSRPGANITIFLDFDGFELDGTTAWNKYMGLPALTVPPFDMDGNPGVFSNRELDAIASTWAYVSEDYAPWNVNVTTVDPGLDALVDNGNGDMKVGIRVGFATPNGELHELACNTGCTGKAYTGVFASTWRGQRIGVADTPALVFTTDTYTTASHEVGHALGLDHHGTSDSEYFWGHGKWSPIMGGTNMARTVTHWSKGEYEDANNSDQDDIARIRNILPIVMDEHSSNPPAATPIQPGQELQSLIGIGGDVDMFRITVTEPTWVQVAPRWSRGANNLDVKMTVSNTANGNTTVINPSNANGDLPGMSASTTLQPGTWVIAVEGSGDGSPFSGGYSNYGSVGTYTLKTTNSAPATVKISGPGLWAVPLAGKAGVFPYTVTGGVAPFTWDVPTGLPGDLSLSSSGQLTGWAPESIGRWSITVVATDATGQQARFNATISTADSKSGPIRDSLTLTIPATVNGEVGVNVNQELVAAGGAGGYILEGYDLPPGTRVTKTNGRFFLTGAPTRSGTYDSLVTVWDADGNATDTYFTVKVAPGDPANTTVSMTGKTSVKRGQSVAVTVYLNGGTNPVITSPTPGKNIPGTKTFKLTRYTAGDTSDKVAYRITGKATVKGTYPITLTIKSGSKTYKAPLRIRVR